MVVVNCATLPDSLLESELFGYRAGAFTGASKDKPGLFTVAGEGTIFLDEIGDLSPVLQTKLLRVLQERTYLPLGSTEAERTGARFITATNRPLSTLVEGRPIPFRPLLSDQCGHAGIAAAERTQGRSALVGGKNHPSISTRNTARK